MDIKANTGADHSRITISVPEMDVMHQAENIITNVIRAHEESDLEYIKGIITKGIMTRAMKGDAAVDILTYLPTGHERSGKRYTRGQSMVRQGKRHAKQ